MSTGRVLPDAEAAHGYLHRICFKTGPPGVVGAELEWLVAREGDRRAPVPSSLTKSLLAAAGPLPGRSLVSFEPGGQVELSSLPAPDVVSCCAALAGDVAHLESALGAAGLVLVPAGVDPDRPPARQSREPRYDAMAAYFDTLHSELGVVMMTSTAGVQVNLDAGADPADVARRWRMLHLVGPTLSAAFANSPIHRGALTGWRSTRQAVWLRLDPSRTSPPPSGDPWATWAEYVLAAPVMMLRTANLPWLPAPGFTFGDWVGGRVGDLAPPTEDDLGYHLTTLFPPVRPRGWFEVRYLDAQDPRWWSVPVVVLATLLEQSEHPELVDAVAEACEPVTDAWLTAARHGLADPGLARAAQTVFESVLPLVGDAALRMSVEQFAARHVDRARCPADDVLDGFETSFPPRTKQKELR